MEEAKEQQHAQDVPVKDMTVSELLQHLAKQKEEEKTADDEIKPTTTTTDDTTATTATTDAPTADGVIHNDAAADSAVASDPPAAAEEDDNQGYSPYISAKKLCQGPPRTGEIGTHISAKTVTFYQSTGTYGCSHSQQVSRIRGRCCEVFYGCRSCHDQMESHYLRRRDVFEMVCMKCVDLSDGANSRIQPVSNECIYCHEKMAEHYCDICHHHSLVPPEEDRSVYHCIQCGESDEGVEKGVGICVTENSCDHGRPEADKKERDAKKEKREAEERKKMNEVRKAAGLPPLKKDESSDPEKDAEILSRVSSASSIRPPVPAPVPKAKPVWQMRSAFHPHLLTVITPDSSLFNETAKCSDCEIELGSHAYAQCREHLDDADGGCICEFLLCINCIQEQHARVDRKQQIAVRQYLDVKKETGEIVADQPVASLPFGPHTFTLCSVVTAPDVNASSGGSSSSSSSSDDPYSGPPPALKPCCNTSLNIQHWHKENDSAHLRDEGQRLSTMHRVARRLAQVPWKAVYDRVCKREGWVPHGVGEKDSSSVSSSLQQLQLQSSSSSSSLSSTTTTTTTTMSKQQRLFEDALRVITTYPAELQQYLPSIETNSQPPDLYLPTLHDHPLRFYPFRYHASYSCNVCAVSSSSAAYACDGCQYDAHLSCVIPMEKMDLLREQCKPSTSASSTTTTSSSLLTAVQYFLAPRSTPLHEHVLQPHQDRYGYSIKCSLCDRTTYDTIWYKCRPECYYFVHLSCMLFQKHAEWLKRSLEEESEKEGHSAEYELLRNELFRLEEDMQEVYTLCLEQNKACGQKEPEQPIAQPLLANTDAASTTDPPDLQICTMYRRHRQEALELNGEKAHWKCSRAQCVSQHYDRLKLHELAVYRCEECKTNMCFECAAQMHAEGAVQIVENGLECDAASVRQWCTGDAVSPAIQMDKINEILDTTEGKTGLMMAIEKRDTKQVAWLLQNGAQVWKRDSENRNSLQYATLTGDPTLVSLILAYRPSVTLLTPSSDVSQTDGEETETETEPTDEDLLDTRADESEPNSSPLGHAASTGALELVKLLIESGAKPKGSVWLAAANGHLPVLQYLLSTKPELVDDLNVDSRNGYESYALHVACQIGNQEIVNLLLRSGAEVRVEDSSSHTCLWQAVTCKYERPSILSALLYQFKKPQIKSMKGRRGGAAGGLKYTQPFFTQSLVSKWEEHISELIRGKGYGSHLALMLPYDNEGFIIDKVKQREYPAILIDAALKGHLTFVDVVLKEMARLVLQVMARGNGAGGASGGTNGGASSSNNHTNNTNNSSNLLQFSQQSTSLRWTQIEVEQVLQAMMKLDEEEAEKEEKRKRKEKSKKENKEESTSASVDPDADPDAVQEFTSDDTSSTTSSPPSTRRFQHNGLTQKNRDTIAKNLQVYMMLSFPHIYYAYEGGINSLMMVSFALDHLCAFPSETVSSGRLENIPLSVRDAWLTKETDIRRGFTVMHAACASKACSRALIQMLMKRGASPVSIAEMTKFSDVAVMKKGAAGGKKSSSALTARIHPQLSLADELSRRTPLYFLLRNQDVSPQERLDICRDMALVVGAMYEEAMKKLKEGKEKGKQQGKPQLPFSPSSSSSSPFSYDNDPSLTLPRLFAKQMSADERTVSIAWKTIGTMFTSFVSEAIPSATAEQLVSALGNLSADAQKKLLFDSQLSQHVIMSLLPLLANSRQLSLLRLLGENEQTQYVHTNSTRDHLSVLSVLACSGFASGVDMILTNHPSPALTNSCDALGRAPIKIAIERWIGQDDAVSSAQTFIRSLAQQYKFTHAPSPPNMTVDQWLEAQESGKIKIMADLAALPVATLNVVHAEYEELRLIREGKKTVDLLANTEYVGDNEYGQSIRFNLKPHTPNPQCPVPLCQLPLEVYCSECARYLCKNCLQVVHQSDSVDTAEHVTVTIAELKESYELRYKALDSLLRVTTRQQATNNSAPTDGNHSNQKLTPTATQQLHRHSVLQLLFSGAGKFDLIDIIAAVRHWSFDILNFRTKDFAGVGQKEKQHHQPHQQHDAKSSLRAPTTESTAISILPISSTTDEEEDPHYSSTLLGNRSILHLAAFQQDVSLIDSLLHLLLQPKLEMKLLNAHHQFKYYQLLLWGDEENGVKLAGLEFYHHQTHLTQTLSITDIRGRRIVWPYVDRSYEYRSSGGQTLIYITAQHPVIFTHYELLYDLTSWDAEQQPQQWQLSGSNDDRAEHMHSSVTWFVVHRYTRENTENSDSADADDGTAEADKPSTDGRRDESDKKRKALPRLQDSSSVIVPEKRSSIRPGTKRPSIRASLMGVMQQAAAGKKSGLLSSPGSGGSSALVPIALQSASPVSQAQSLTGRLSLIDLNHTHTHPHRSSSGTEESESSGYLYYRFLFTSTYERFWRCNFESVRFMRGVRDLTPNLIKEGISHQSDNENSAPPGTVPIDLYGYYERGTRHVFVPYPTTDLNNQKTRFSVIYEFESECKVTSYSLQCSDNPFFSPNRWKLYGTNHERAATQYKWTREIDPESEQEKPWVLIDEQEQPPFPQPQTKIMNVELQRMRNVNMTAASTNSGNSTEKKDDSESNDQSTSAPSTSQQPIPIESYRYYRLDILSTFSDDTNSYVALSAIKMLDTEGEIVLPQTWINPRGYTSDDSGISLDSLNQHDSDTYWMDYALGSIGYSELIACFTSPIQLHSYEFQRYRIHYSSSYHEPRSWTLAGSNDKQNWTLLQTMTDAKQYSLFSLLPEDKQKYEYKAKEEAKRVEEEEEDERKKAAAALLPPPEFKFNDNYQCIPHPFYLSTHPEHPVFLVNYPTEDALFTCPICGIEETGDTKPPVAPDNNDPNPAPSSSSALVPDSPSQVFFCCQKCDVFYKLHTHCAWKVRDRGDGENMIRVSNEKQEEQHEYWKEMTETNFNKKIEQFRQQACTALLTKREKLHQERDKVMTVKDHTHPLTLLIAPRRQGFRCDICSEYADPTGLSFCCEACNWDAHTTCAWNNRDETADRKYTLNETEFNAEIARVQKGKDEEELEKKTMMWSKPIFVKREDALEAKRLGQEKDPDAVAAALMRKRRISESQANSPADNIRPSLNPASSTVTSPPSMQRLLRASSELTALKTYRQWLQRRQHNGSLVNVDEILQAIVEPISEANSDVKGKKGSENSSNSNQLTSPTAIAAERDAPLDVKELAPHDPKEQARILAERELHDLIQRSPRSLIRRIRKLFDPDAAGLTPRDYALTLPVSRTLRKWERVLQLSIVGMDAIVVFDQPQLIDSNVFEQFFRTMGAKIWNSLTCARKEDVEKDTPKKVVMRMKKLAYSIEQMGLAVNLYHNGVNGVRKNGENNDNDDNPEVESDPTAVLLVTSSYSRLLLECSSRALQDDPQYERHRKLASDWCLPANMQDSKCAKRVPFTTAQRQALVMRILSGLGADLNALSTLQHYKLNNELAEEEEELALEEVELQTTAEAASSGSSSGAASGGSANDGSQSHRSLRNNKIAASDLAALMPKKSWTNTVLPKIERGGGSRAAQIAAAASGGSGGGTGTAAPKMLSLLALARRAKEAEAKQAQLDQQHQAMVEAAVSSMNMSDPHSTHAAALPVHHSDAIHGADDVARVDKMFKKMRELEAEEQKRRQEEEERKEKEEKEATEKGAEIRIRINGSDHATTAGGEDETNEKTKKSKTIHTTAAASKASSSPVDNLALSPSAYHGVASTPSLVGTDAIDHIISQTAHVNVLQMVARSEVRALSLMHSEGEKQLLEHAWRHWRISEQEYEHYQGLAAHESFADGDDTTVVATAAVNGSTGQGGQREDDDFSVPQFPLPSKDAPGRYSLLLQPFTATATRFALREGEQVIDKFYALAQLRSYAGDRVAFFFAFVAYSLIWQFLLFAPGVVLTIYSYFFEHNPALPWNSVFVMVWSTVFIDRWHRKSSELAFKYGTLGYEDTEACRPQFSGWRVTLTPKELLQKKTEHDERIKQRLKKYVQKRVEYSRPGNSAPLPKKYQKQLKIPAFDPASLVIPTWLRYAEAYVAESDTGVIQITCREESIKREKKLKWYEHIFRLFSCSCRRQRPMERVTVIIAQRINPITDEKEDFYPVSIYYTKLFLTTLLMLAMMFGVIWINLLILDFKNQYYTDPTDHTGFAPYWKSFIGVLTGITMKVLHTFYLILTEAILVWENHRTDSSHSNAKIVKTFCFAFINSYFSLFYIALTSDATTASHELATQLISVMASRTVTGIFFEDVLPYFVFWYMKKKLETQRAENGEEVVDTHDLSAMNSVRKGVKNGGNNKANVADESALLASLAPSNAKPAAIVVPKQHSTHSPIPSPSAAGNTPSASPDATSHSVVINVKPATIARPPSISSRRDSTESKQAWAPNEEQDTSVEMQAPAKKMLINVEPDERAGRQSIPTSADEKPQHSDEDDESHDQVSPMLEIATRQESRSYDISGPIIHHTNPHKKKLTTRASTASEFDPLASQPLSYHVGTASALQTLHHDAQLEIQRPAAPSLLDNYLEIITQIGYVTCFSAVFPAAPLLVIGSLSLIGHGLLYKYLHIAQRPMQERAADIGAWVSVLTFLSFASIFTNCILIFHSSDQWEPYSGGYSRQTCMLGFALILFIFKVIIMAIIPDQAGWVSTRLLATKYRQDKLHANEVTHAQSNDAIAIERAYLKQKIDTLQMGVQHEHEAGKKKNN